MKEITHYTNTEEFPSGLKTAKEIADAVFMNAERIENLAEMGIVPHWVIDGGKPLFRVTEIKNWIKNNAMTKCNGSQAPIEIKISPLAPIADSIKAPPEIREITGLRKIPQGDYAPCVYFLCKNDAVVYVGQSISVANRISAHIRDKDFDEVYLVHVPKIMLTKVEAAMIRHLQPPLNGNPPSSDFSFDNEIINKVFQSQYAQEQQQ